MLVRRLIEQRHRLLKSAWISLVERSNLEKASAVHATSTVEAEELQKFGWRLRRIETQPNRTDEADGAGADEPSEDVKARADAQPLIPFLRPLWWVKGLETLLRGCARSSHGTLAI